MLRIFFRLVRLILPNSWCGHCKAMKDEYIKAAEAMNGIGNFGAVDATAEQMLASKYKFQGIKSLPFPIGRFPYSSHLHSSF